MNDLVWMTNPATDNETAVVQAFSFLTGLPIEKDRSVGGVFVQYFRQGDEMRFTDDPNHFPNSPLVAAIRSYGKVTFIGWLFRCEAIKEFPICVTGKLAGFGSLHNWSISHGIAWNKRRDLEYQSSDSGSGTVEALPPLPVASPTERGKLEEASILFPNL